MLAEELDLKDLTTSGAILGYPTPTLIAWNQTFDDSQYHRVLSVCTKAHIRVDGLLAGGSHKAKISETLKYLEGMDSSQDEDLVLMMDAYGLSSRDLCEHY